MASNPIQDYFVSDPSRLVDEVRELMRVTGRLSALIEKGEAVEGQGFNYQSLLIARSGNADDVTWTSVGANSSGTLPNTCNPDPLDVNPANIVYNYGLIQSLIRSNFICMQDVRTAYMYQKQVMGIRTNFKALVVDAWETQDKKQYFTLAGNKIVANAALTNYQNQTDFGTALPTSQLTAGIMRNIYQQLIRDAGGETPVAMVNGAAQFMMLCSPEQQQSVLQNDAAIRQDIHFAQMGEGSAAWLLQAWGVDRAYAGFMFINDVKMPRFDYNYGTGAWIPRPYYTTAPATNGTQLIVNPAYTNAAFEDVYVFLKVVVKRNMPRPFSSAGSDVQFDAVNFNGDILWKNIPQPDTNPLGLIGRYYAALMAAYEPLEPQYGYIIRCQRCSNLTLQACY